MIEALQFPRQGYVIQLFIRRCDESCPSDRWGPGCTLPCDCGGQRNECHPETGRCADDHVPIESTSITANTEEEDNEVRDITTTERNEESSAIWETDATTEGNRRIDSFRLEVFSRVMQLLVESRGPTYIIYSAANI